MSVVFALTGLGMICEFTQRLRAGLMNVAAPRLVQPCTEKACTEKACTEKAYRTLSAWRP
jgi:hypothetical protein